MSPFPDRMSPFLPDVSPFHREVRPSPDDVSPFRRKVRPFHATISQDSRAVSPLRHHLGLLGPSVCPPAKPVDQSYVGCHSEMCGNDADAAKASQAIVAADWPGRAFEHLGRTRRVAGVGTFREIPGLRPKRLQLWPPRRLVVIFIFRRNIAFALRNNLVGGSYFVPKSLHPPLTVNADRSSLDFNENKLTAFRLNWRFRDECLLAIHNSRLVVQ